MVNYQKIFDKFSEKKIDFTENSQQMRSLYLRNLYFTLFFVAAASIFWGFASNILISVSALMLAIFYLVILWLYQKKIISFYLIRFFVFFSTSIFIFYDFYLNSTGDNVLYLFYYLVLVSVFLFNKNDLFLYPIIALLILDLLFAITDNLSYYTTKQIILFNALYLVLLFSMYFFKRWQLSEVRTFNQINKKEKIRIEYEKKNYSLCRSPDTNDRK